MRAFEKLAILCIIFYVLNVPVTLKVLFNDNFVLDYYPYFFLLAPLLLIVFNRALVGKLIMPYIKNYLIVAVLFYIYENIIFRENPDISYLISLTLIYLCFIIFVNYCKTYQQRKEVIVYVLFTIIGIGFISYLNLFGVISFVEADVLEELDSNSLIHPNGQSISCLIGIVLIGIIKQERLLNIGNMISLILTLFLLSIIILNATRGILILSFVYIFSYGYYFHFKSTIQKFTIFFFLMTMIYLIYMLIIYLFPNININLQIIEQLKETSFGEARGYQITININNFLNNILIGSGYYDAGRGLITDFDHYSDKNGYIRSNFSYTQILAAYGISIFPIYMYFIYSMFGAKIKKFNNILIMFICLGSLMFYNLSILLQLSFLSYLLYAEYCRENLLVRNGKL